MDLGMGFDVVPWIRVCQVELDSWHR